jgi:hypothetical protein
MDMDAKRRRGCCAENILNHEWTRRDTNETAAEVGLIEIRDRLYGCVILFRRAGVCSTP